MQMLKRVAVEDVYNGNDLVSMKLQLVSKEQAIKVIRE